MESVYFEKEWLAACEERNEARDVARRFYRRAQELEAERIEAQKTGDGWTEANAASADVDALVAAINGILEKQETRRFGTAFYNLPPHLRDRIHVPGEG